MSRFIQLHALTVYAPSNLNRDDNGRPKTARFGGAERLRISSQALKRAIRTSPKFQERLEGHLGARTARAGDWLRDDLIKHGVEAAKAMAIAKTLSAIFGTPDGKKPDPLVHNRELFFMAPQERLALGEMTSQIAKDSALANELAEFAGEVEDEDEEGDEDEGKAKKSKKKGLPKKRLRELQSKVLVEIDTAADIAMFGRMVASAPKYNREAAVQVAHAITTHRVEVEDDFYTAVDDLKNSSEDAGASFVGELGFGSGVFYLYACIDRDQLMRNLGGDEGLASSAIAAFTEGFASVSPSGKQNSFAAHSRASYLRVEKGDQQPRSLAAAFFKPVRDDHDHDLLGKSLARLRGGLGHEEAGLIDEMNKAYGACFDAAKEMRVIPGAAVEGSLKDLIAFAAAA